MKLMEYDGQLHEICGIFSGDGALYDQIRTPNCPVRLGTLLLRPIEIPAEVVAEIGEIPDTKVQQYEYI